MLPLLRGLEAVEFRARAEDRGWAEAYLAGIDLLTAKGIVVGTHCGGRWCVAYWLKEDAMLLDF